MLIHIHLVLIPLLLGFAAMFAASEASLFSLTRAQLEALRESRPQLYLRIRNLIFRPEALLSTVIIGNECLNILIGTFITGLLQFHYGGLNETLTVFISVLISSFLLLTFSEILPKVLAFRVPILVASIVVIPMTIIHFLLTPFRKIFLAISGRFLKLFGIRPEPPSAVNEKDFLTMVEVGAETGSLDTEEKEMIFNVFNFSDLSVSSVMTPWERVFHLRDNTPLETVLEEVRKHTFSRVPILSSKENRVVGVLYTKELLKLLLATDDSKNSETLRQAIFPPYIVSVHKKVSKLFKEFQLKKVHLALVVDEYGNHLGIVTLEDVLKSLFQTRKKVHEVRP